jgi:hypothetical protein
VRYATLLLLFSSQFLFGEDVSRKDYYFTPKNIAEGMVVHPTIFGYDRPDEELHISIPVDIQRIIGYSDLDVHAIDGEGSEIALKPVDGAGKEISLLSAGLMFGIFSQSQCAAYSLHLVGQQRVKLVRVSIKGKGEVTFEVQQELKGHGLLPRGAAKVK